MTNATVDFKKTTATKSTSKGKIAIAVIAVLVITGTMIGWLLVDDTQTPAAKSTHVESVVSDFSPHMDPTAPRLATCDGKESVTLRPYNTASFANTELRLVPDVDMLNGWKIRTSEPIDGIAVVGSFTKVDILGVKEAVGGEWVIPFYSAVGNLVQATVCTTS